MVLHHAYVSKDLFLVLQRANSLSDPSLMLHGAYVSKKSSLVLYKNRVVKVSPGGSHLASRTSLQLTPARSSLLPMANEQFSMYWVPTTSGEQGARGRAGSKLEQGSELGVSWSKMSKPNVILGFRVPTTIGRKTSIITYSAYVSPPPGSKVPTQCPLT